MNYFPLEHDEYAMRMNARAGVVPLIEVDHEEYEAELALKSQILESAYRYYFQCSPEAEGMAWESVGLLLQDMAQTYPDDFELTVRGKQWTWTNRLLGETVEFTRGEPASLPLPPLDWLARQVQEDLILMEEMSDGKMVCVAGHLCFGASWCLDDKIGKSFLDIHDEVPEFRERIGQPSDLMMRRLKPGRPTGRFNWSIAATSQLNLAPAIAHEWQTSRHGITATNAGERCFLRVERQTLSRLPLTRGILFTIHTYLTPIAEVAANRDRLRRLVSVLKGIPAVTLEYKGMTGYIEPLMIYLDSAEV